MCRKASEGLTLFSEKYIEEYLIPFLCLSYFPCEVCGTVVSGFYWIRFIKSKHFPFPLRNPLTTGRWFYFNFGRTVLYYLSKYCNRDKLLTTVEFTTKWC